MKLFWFLLFVGIVLAVLYTAGVFAPVATQIPQHYGPSADAWAKVCQTSGLFCK